MPVVGSSHRFPQAYHLKNRRSFSRLAQRGRLFTTDHLMIQWGKSEESHSRIGVTVQRRFGSAVERNTFRRRAKEAFRLSKLREMPGIDINLKPKHSLPIPYSEFCAAFEKLEKLLSKGSSRTSSGESLSLQ
jgi:ribonuclease P protein component